MGATMVRLLPALVLGFAIIGCSKSSDPTASSRPKHPLDTAPDGGGTGDLTTPDMDAATLAAQDKSVAFVLGLKGKVKKTNHAVVEVDLSFKPVTDAELKELTAMKNLAVLNLAYTQVTDSGLKELAAFKNLTTLSLRGTKVTGVGFRALAPLKSFTTLDLRATPVTDAGLREIAMIKSLTSLDIIAILGTVDGVKDLQRLLPKCKIEKIQ